MKVIGTIIPLADKVLVADMNFEGQRTRSGILIPGDNGKVTGIHPRWGRVWAVGPDQKDVKVGEWILVEHGRWTRGFEYEEENGTKVELRMVDNNAILISADEPVTDVLLAG
jgi:co-chaperonin GroES (HSP10)